MFSWFIKNICTSLPPPPPASSQQEARDGQSSICFAFATTQRSNKAKATRQRANTQHRRKGHNRTQQATGKGYGSSGSGLEVDSEEDSEDERVTHPLRRRVTVGRVGLRGGWTSSWKQRWRQVVTRMEKMVGVRGRGGGVRRRRGRK